VNIFTSPGFLEVLGDVYFPGRQRSIELRQVEGRVLRLLLVEGRVITSAPFYDFPQPLEQPAEPGIARLAYFPRTVLRTAPVVGRVESEPEAQASPFVDWSRFPDAPAFEAWLEARGTRRADSLRRRRRLEREAGPLRFTFDDPAEETFAACLKWKGEQYLASGHPNFFAEARSVELFRRLRERKLLVATSLRAGETLVAAQLDGLYDRRFALWIPAYDPKFASHSPGRLLLEDTLHASQALGHREFDFLIGDEAYKFTYATDNRVIGPLGVPPLRVRLERRARALARAALNDRPRLKALVGALRARLERLRSARTRDGVDPRSP
jgi:CelD/BcsL family acetyltransferase involved in cellulose biosynthesis